MHKLLIQLLGHARGMWRYRWYALLAAWVLCLTGWAAVYATPDNYEAHARVHVDTQSMLKPLLRGLAVESDIDARVSIVTRTLLSRPNLEKVIRETGLALRAKTPRDMEDLLVRLNKEIKIWSRDRRENLYTITYRDKNPQIAMRVVQVLLDTLLEGTLGSGRADAIMAQRFLVEQIQDYEARLTEAEQRLADFKKENVGMMPSEGRGYYARLQEGSNVLQKIRSSMKVAENRRGELKKQLEELESAPLRSPAVEITIKERQADLDGLLLKYTESHPDVIALQQTLTRLEERRQRGQERSYREQKWAIETSKVYQAIKIALSKAEVEVATLRGQLADQQRSTDRLNKLVDTIPEVEAKLARLNRDYSITKTQYEKLVQRLSSARLAKQAEETGDDIKFRIIDPPVVPRRPVDLNRLLYLTAVLLGGIMAGIALAFLLNDIRPVFMDARGLREATGLPVLGVVSMKWQPKQKFWLRIQLASLVLATTLLVFTYGGVVTFQDVGVRITQSLLTMG